MRRLCEDIINAAFRINDAMLKYARYSYRLGLPRNLVNTRASFSFPFVIIFIYLFIIFLILFDRGFVGSGIAAVSRKDRIPNEYTWFIM